MKRQLSSIRGELVLVQILIDANMPKLKGMDFTVQIILSMFTK